MSAPPWKSITATTPPDPSSALRKDDLTLWGLNPPHSETSAGGLVKGVGSTSGLKLNCMRTLSTLGVFTKVVNVKLVNVWAAITQFPRQNSTESLAPLFVNVIGGSPKTLDVTVKVHADNAYVAFGAKPCTLVAKGAAALSYVNVPETEVPSANAPENSNVTGIAWADVKTPNSRDSSTKLTQCGFFIQGKPLPSA